MALAIIIIIIINNADKLYKINDREFKKFYTIRKNAVKERETQQCYMKLYNYYIYIDRTFTDFYHHYYLSCTMDKPFVY